MQVGGVLESPAILLERKREGKSGKRARSMPVATKRPGVEPRLK